MKEINVQEEEGLLDDLLPVLPEKGKLFHAVTAASLFYIVFFLVNYLFDLKRFSVKEFAWQFVLVFLLLPLLAVVFHLKSKKIGWYIGYFYYTGMSMLGIYSLLHQLTEVNTLSRGLPNWRGIALLLLTSIVAIFLLSKPVREYFRVRTLTLIVTTIFAIVTGVVLHISLL